MRYLLTGVFEQVQPNAIANIAGVDRRNTPKDPVAEQKTNRQNAGCADGRCTKRSGYGMLVAIVGRTHVPDA